MRRKRTVKIATTRRCKLNLDQIVFNLRCPACGHKIQTPNAAQTRAMFEIAPQALPKLVYQEQDEAKEVETDAQQSDVLRLSEASESSKPSR